MFSLVDITFQMVIIAICPVNVQLNTPGAQIYRPLSQSFYYSRVTQSAWEIEWPVLVGDIRKGSQN